VDVPGRPVLGRLVADGERSAVRGEGEAVDRPRGAQVAQGFSRAGVPQAEFAAGRGQGFAVGRTGEAGQVDFLLRERGFPVSKNAVWALLRRMGFSMRTNVRKRRGITRDPAERDEQFRYIAAQRKAFSEAGRPVISVDTKKKDLIGNFRNPGQAWCRKPPEVNEHDYASQAECLAVPFGVYDVAKNAGYVVVGTSHNTPMFAVTSIARWWEEEGSVVYPEAKEVLILADGGGGNGRRSKAWKLNLQEKFCDRFGLAVSVCHYPPGCSKWNPVEHRLFSRISVNWAGKPLRSLRIMLGYIRGATTTTGLTVKACLDDETYGKGQKVTREDMERINLKPHVVCSGLNYTIGPAR
jgi:hypothetical protein